MLRLLFPFYVLSMKIVGVQLDCVWEDKAANFLRVERLLGASEVERDSLIVLPEMFATGFSLDVAVTAESTGGETEEFLRGLSAKCNAAVLGGLVRQSDDGRIYNEAVAYAPGGECLVRYAKQRPFSGAGESEVHGRGSGVATFDWGGFKIAPLVCYDLRFPELFRDAARAGAELFAVIAAWPTRRIEHWTTLLRARAIENQAAVVGVNRTGREPDADYCGRSLVIDAQGVVVADAGEKECVVSASLDAGEVRRWRSEFPALRDGGLA